MNVYNHPDESWIVSYANGALDPLFNDVIAAHLSLCTHCQETLRDADELGAEFMNLASAMAIEGHSDAAHTETAHTERASADVTVTEWTGETRSDLETFVREHIGPLDDLKWRNAGSGLKVSRLAKHGDCQSWLLRAAPGTVLPKHGHTASELTLILKGAYACGNRIYGEGDIEDADEDLNHQPIVTVDGECVCLAVMDGRLRFDSVIHRLAQPFIGL